MPRRWLWGEFGFSLNTLEVGCVRAWILKCHPESDVICCRSHHPEGPAAWQISSGLTEGCPRRSSRCPALPAPCGAVAMHQTSISQRSMLSLRCWRRRWMPWAGNSHSFNCLTAFRAAHSHPDPFCLWWIRMERLSTVDCCLIIFEQIAKMTSGQVAGPIRPLLSETISSSWTFLRRYWIDACSQDCLKIVSLGYWPDRETG